MRQSVLSEKSRKWIYEPADAGQEIEVIHWSFYDWKTLAAGAMATSYSFFNTPSGTPVGAGTANKETSNIPKPLSIGSPYKFLLQEVGFAVFPSGRGYCTGSAPTADHSIIADMTDIICRGVATLRVLGVDRLEVSPLLLLPSGFGLTGPGDLNTKQGALQSNGWPVLSNRYPVEIGLHKDTTFEMNVDFPAGAITIYNAMKFGFVFDGLLQRPKGK